MAGVGRLQLAFPVSLFVTITLATDFAAAVDDPERFRRSRDIGAYLGLVPRRYQSGEVDYTGSISKSGVPADANPCSTRPQTSC